MKKVVILCIVCLILFAALPAQAEDARPILFTAYRQMGWGDAVQAGYIDADGGMWTIEGYDHELNLPWNTADQLAWLSSVKVATRVGELDRNELFTLKSLVECVQPQDGEPVGAANDAGTEVSYAVRYSGDEAETVLLGVSGDSMYENTDPSAQALYLILRQTFTGVTSYYGNRGMGPSGFKPISLMEFCGYAGLDLSGARVTRRDIDCEASTEPVELTADESKSIIDMVLGARVTGKQSCIVTTGGSTYYAFTDEGGKALASFEFYRGLLVTDDGMYYVGD